MEPFLGSVFLLQPLPSPGIPRTLSLSQFKVPTKMHRALCGKFHPGPHPRVSPPLTCAGIRWDLGADGIQLGSGPRGWAQPRIREQIQGVGGLGRGQRLSGILGPFGPFWDVWGPFPGFGCRPRAGIMPLFLHPKYEVRVPCSRMEPTSLLPKPHPCSPELDPHPSKPNPCSPSRSLLPKQDPCSPKTDAQPRSSRTDPCRPSPTAHPPNQLLFQPGPAPREEPFLRTHSRFSGVTEPPQTPRALPDSSRVPQPPEPGGGRAGRMGAPPRSRTSQSADFPEKLLEGSRG